MLFGLIPSNKHSFVPQTKKQTFVERRKSCSNRRRHADRRSIVSPNLTGYSRRVVALDRRKTGADRRRA